MRTDWRTVLVATLAAGVAAAVIEMVVVLPIQGLLGATPVRVFQGIAAGALGRSALRGGLAAAGLGVLIHVLVSVVAAGLDALAATRWTLLLRRPALMGIAYGVPVYLVMNFVVIPLSALGFSFPTSLLLFALSFGVHLFAFGLPIGLVCRWVMGRPSLAHP